MQAYASPVGTGKPRVTRMKWWISASMSEKTRSFGGSTTLASSEFVGTVRQRLQHLLRMRTLCRISATRTM